MTNERRQVFRETALRAAELIKAGWCQRDYQSFDDSGKACYCAIGAVSVAGEEIGITPGDVRTVVGYACDEVGGVALHEWNDDPSRTQSEVVALFRRVAAQFNPPGWESVEV